ncbi:F-box/kelch-repeat protein SKIP4-like [Triticum dicoccoides]|uniref:F-box/kelch-repeat protein SKIP4-like n=1 Tax=Triticum dicoccoides TaxID=85692 RepID=UPI000E7CFE19|nr:F-box/kelch-repeat protein SKIP4-like [Triticum dicoccoides]XP_037449878.1 F-box/kelch-repeat protein SKIP4-like [Triticum dicoccoides]
MGTHAPPQGLESGDYQKLFCRKMESAELQTPLLHGLPDEIALLCLARVPRQYHNALRCVSRGWKALLCSEEWHSYRKRNNLDESWIYVICRGTGFKCYVLVPDPTTRCLKVIQVMEPPCSGREGVSIESLDRRLFLMGGCSWLKDATDEVYCYDAASNHWSKAAPMPTARCFFVTAALNDKIYVTGGLGLTDKSPNSWDIYDKATDSWFSHKNPMLTPDIVKFVALDDELVTIHKASWNRMYFAGIYDPVDQSWRGKENEIALCWSGPTVVVDGTLYMLDQSLGTKLMMWINETKEWVMVGRLSDKLTRPPCELVAIGRKIYVIGKGLSTVTIDMDMAARVDGFLVSSSTGPLMEHDFSPEKCSVITI